MLHRAAEFRKEVSRRRSVREFSNEPVSREVIEQCLLSAGSEHDNGTSAWSAIRP